MATQTQKTKQPATRAVLFCLLVVTLLVLAGALLYTPAAAEWGWPRLGPQALLGQALKVWLGACALCLLLIGGAYLGGGQALRVALGAGSIPALPLEPADERSQATWPSTLRLNMRHLYGRFWRRRLRVVLVVGEPEQIEAIAPTLARQHWLEAEGVLLLHGGSLQAAPSAVAVGQWQTLHPRRPFDAVVWALSSEQVGQPVHLDTGLRHLRSLAQTLQWQAPLHLWEVYRSPWPDTPRKTLPAGCLLGREFSTDAAQAQLAAMVGPLAEAGMSWARGDNGYVFYYWLSAALRDEGIGRWGKALQPLVPALAQGVWLRGLWFSLPLTRVEGGMPSLWQPDASWNGILQDTAEGRWAGWPARRMAYVGGLALAAVCVLGVLVSFALNRSEIAHIQALQGRLEHPAGEQGGVEALYDLTLEIDYLAGRASAGAPWYARFGLDRSQALLDHLRPTYATASQRLLRDPLAQRLAAQLAQAAQLPAGSLARQAHAEQGYQALKAYLMLARPERLDARFMLGVASQGEGNPELWRVYFEQLAQHPQWALSMDHTLVARARQVLLSELGQRSAENTLYAQVLASVAAGFPDLGLAQLVGGTAAGSLFSTGKVVPGMFTRQAWEGRVRDAIEQAAEARREQVDWVLSDHPGQLDPAATPQALKQRLAARYFQDYNRAWLEMLNSVRFTRAGSLGENVEQLALLADAQQSPLLALLNSVAWQAKAGGPSGLAGDWLASAKQALGQGEHALPISAASAAPLASGLGPWLALVEPGPAPADGAPSLAAYLSQVTQLRLRLEQVLAAADPQAMTLALAQGVFQGNSTELGGAQAYGQLVAASLGGQWRGAGQALFVQPLEQAWQRLLRPSAQSLNSQWQRAVVEPWNIAFVGRYPFAASQADASLPLLAQMIRSDSGRIERFLSGQVGGLLRKEGSRWVVDPQRSHGLRVNPELLTALDQLSELADLLFADGTVGLGFELSGKPVRDVVQTTFEMDGKTHEYFNQKERWQRFTWPGSSDRPGVMLTWTSVHSGARLYGDFQGVWGLIRLLEHADAQLLDHAASQYRLVITAPDGLGLTWYLRTEFGAGPLALLKLRGFSLPRQIFLADEPPSASKAKKT
ncbi:ImcF-related family protein [Pseudomonas sp. NPDC007930]|uniref:ImcF-related family protein n=1 Tax=Pseudomonas sp. NPDC007930 TaxID=3364417 RepID=UPI0036EEDF6D